VTNERALSISTSPCLDEEELLAFAGGRLSSDRREVAHRHLDACEVCQQVLNEAVRALATAKAGGGVESDEVAWRTMFRPGMLVGRRYEIRRFIARGGMGEIYEAFDQELQERVALKTVTSTASDNPSAVRRLKAEVQLARRVSHPNVCRIYDFGTHLVTGTGAPISFFTMEFVEGETLGTRIRQSGALSVDEAHRLGRQLLQGLAAAHSAGVLHRDFKSDNVLLRGEGAELTPVILDFGLARALDQDFVQSSGSAWGLVGTLAYMAPDQLEGQPYTTASDVYSFGLVWYEMLTGELPFKVRSSPAITTLDRLTRPVPVPSSKNPAVPATLDTIVLECLHRSASERLQTAADVLARLDELERRAQAQVVAVPRRKEALKLTLALTLALASLAAGATYFALTQGAAVLPPVPRAVAPTKVTIAAALPASLGAAAEQPLVPPVAPAPARPSSKPETAPEHAHSSRAELRLISPKTASQSAATAEPARGDERIAVPASSASFEAQRKGQRAGWEDPFAARSTSPSGKLGAVLEQSLDRRAPSGDAELSEGRR